MYSLYMKRIYIETSIISFLTARPSANMHAESKRQITVDWWHNHRNSYRLFASPLVIQEASAGNSEASEKRLNILKKIPLLEISNVTIKLAQYLISSNAVPQKAKEDALHIAVAAVYSVDYLLTWNCRHIDNAIRKPLIRHLCMEFGYPCAEICTPEELMEV